MDQPQDAAAEQRYPVEFTAQAGEYFRIWIVNMALTIVTLGIYSAWAKVRKRRYFYAHTRIDGEGFEYRGDPVAILKGRLLAAGALALFYGTSKLAPGTALQAMVLVLAALAAPWLIVRSMAFNAYNSAYRNLRFHFVGTYGKCLKILLLWGLFTVVTLGLGYPSLKLRLIRFLSDHLRFGTTEFRLGDFKSRFHTIYVKAVGVAILAYAAVAALAGGVLLIAFVVSPGGGSGARTAGVIFGALLVIGVYFSYFVAFAFLRARIANITFNHLGAGLLRFESDLRAWDLIWLYLVNLLAILFSLGLAMPWVAVRTMRYRASKLTVIATGGLAQFAQAEAAQVSAAGEEVGEAFDMDFGL